MAPHVNLMKPLIFAISIALASTHANAEHFPVPSEAIQKVVFAVGGGNCVIKTAEHGNADFYEIRYTFFDAPCNLGSKRGRISVVMSIKRDDAQLPEAIELITTSDRPDIVAGFKEMTDRTKVSNPEFATMFEAAVAAEQHPKDKGY